MLFIRADGKIAYIAENTVPKSLDTIGVRNRCWRVLELAGGAARKLGIRAGDTVYHRMFKTPEMSAQPCPGQALSDKRPTQAKAKSGCSAVW